MSGEGMIPGRRAMKPRPPEDRERERREWEELEMARLYSKQP